MEVCGGRASTRTNLQIHFMHRHIRDTISILEEVDPPPTPLPCMCDMFIPWAEMNNLHPTNMLCSRGDDRKRQRLADEEANAEVEAAL